ncbi:hypothetical protein ACFO5K_13765 [Nocardia halotolerans]|uniref:Uncharacterized protein n=1 Tax=Nocardia halotolerans TaxID=1755878 RepID=A0ABV8VIC8_9NOCA
MSIRRSSIPVLTALATAIEVVVPDRVLVDGSCDTVGGLWQVLDELRQR